MEGKRVLREVEFPTEEKPILKDVKGSYQEISFFQNIEKVFDSMKKEELLQPNAWKFG